MDLKKYWKEIGVFSVPLLFLLAAVFIPAIISDGIYNGIYARTTEIYAGYFDYSENNTIYFKDKTGYQEIYFEDGTVWQGQMDDNSWIPYFKADGYNFSLLNQSAKCVTVHIKSWRDDYEWHDELDKVTLTFYDKSPEVYYAENLEVI